MFGDQKGDDQSRGFAVRYVCANAKRQKRKKASVKNTDGSTRRLKVTGEESERWPPLGTKAI